MLHRREERILQRFLGKIKIAQPGDQGGEELAVFLPMHTLEEVRCGFDQCC